MVAQVGSGKDVQWNFLVKDKIFSLFSSLLTELHPFKYGLKYVIPAKIRRQGCLEMNHKTTLLQGTKLHNGNYGQSRGE